MRFYTRVLSSQYTYPCSRAEVKAVFGDELLDSVCFGLSPVIELGSRYSPRPKIFGTVIMTLAVSGERLLTSDFDSCSLYIYRVRKEHFNELAREAVRELMKGAMREWLDSRLNRPETEVFGMDELLVEFQNGKLLMHETRFR